jgi:preprotein translocase subunit SecA
MLSFLLGNKNKSNLKKLNKKIKKINSYESELKEKTNEELNKLYSDKDSSEELVLAVIREGSFRSLNMRPFDVQLMGALVMNGGNIAEMKTGEGKTLTAAIASLLMIRNGGKVFVVTVNDYLAERDAYSNKELFNFFNKDVGIILSSIFDNNFKRLQYTKDIVYGTNSEFGFDYLRDNMVKHLSEKVQFEQDMVIVDEIDSILIDEARMPLIVSDKSMNHNINFYEINNLVLRMKKGEEVKVKVGFTEIETQSSGDFVINEETQNIYITEDGVDFIEKELNIENLMKDQETAQLKHYIEQSIRANYLYFNKVDYIVKDNQIILIDKGTGRLSEGRQLSNGLHQAIEAKEGVDISELTTVVSEITYQNYFKLFNKLSGMTGTAKTEETEFFEIYKLEVIEIPTNKPIQRIDSKDIVFVTKKAKEEYLIKKVIEVNKTGRPILIGTVSVESNEELEKLFKKYNIRIEVLNAKNAERESEIISKAGEPYSITLATNMAGRGVDIKLTNKSKELGGLYVIGFERYSNRRIDNQLRGRSGRQGDPGFSQFYISMEDRLIQIFGGDKLKNIVTKLGIDSNDTIESSMISRSIEKAQIKIENAEFEQRKELLKYDKVISAQRDIIFEKRNDILNKDYDINNKINELIEWSLSYIYKDSEFLDKEIIFERIEDIYMIQIEGEIPSKEDFEKFLKDIIHEKYDQIEDSLKEQLFKEFYLTSIDEEWINHLNTLEELKSGTKLRAYNQKDPIVEFTKEAYIEYNIMISKIQKMILRKIIHSEIKIVEKSNIEDMDEIKNLEM